MDIHEDYPQPLPVNDLIPGQNMGKWLVDLGEVTKPGTILTYHKQHYWFDPERKIKGDSCYIRALPADSTLWVRVMPRLR